MAGIVLGSDPSAYIQQIQIGGTCNGTAPAESTASYVQTSRKIYAPAMTGGLFQFVEQGNKCLTFLAFELVLGGQSTWSVAITDGVDNLVANDVQISYGTTDASILVPEVMSVFLLPGQQVRINTTGTASNAWRLTVKVARTLGEGGIWI